MEPVNDAGFLRKKGALWQKNRGSAENISHFFSCFFDFLGFLASQLIALQEQTRIQTPPKKSYLKTYRRFFGFSKLCQNRLRVRWHRQNGGRGNSREKSQKARNQKPFCAFCAFSRPVHSYPIGSAVFCPVPISHNPILTTKSTKKKPIGCPLPIPSCPSCSSW
jgi:hypothetical protein